MQNTQTATARLLARLEPIVVGLPQLAEWMHTHHIVLTGSFVLQAWYSVEWPSSDVDFHVLDSVAENIAAATSPDWLQRVFGPTARPNPAEGVGSPWSSRKAVSVATAAFTVEISWNHKWIRDPTLSWAMLDNFYSPDQGLIVGCLPALRAKTDKVDIYSELANRVLAEQRVDYALHRILARIQRYVDRGFRVVW